MTNSKQNNESTKRTSYGLFNSYPSKLYETVEARVVKNQERPEEPEPEPK